jgi:CspA family cold shock protein
LVCSKLLGYLPYFFETKEKDVMAEGKIKNLTDRGFGFIDTGNRDKDLFFHSSKLQGVRFDELQVGDTVEYTEAQGPKGPCAENVRLRG